MSTTNPNSFPPYVHPDDPARNLAPDVPLMVDGLDCSWLFVYYKAIPDRPGYCVGTDGSLWSRWKPTGGGRVGITYVLGDWARRNGSVYSTGHVMIRLRRSDPGQKKDSSFHELVLGTFIGPCPPGLEGCHNDGNPQNNSLTNLRWDTYSSNFADAVRHGRTEKTTGENHHNAKLKESDIHRIFGLYRSGMRKREIARLFGVGEGNIGQIIHRKSWKHVAV